MRQAGSIWRKWNFHVHTKGTNKNDGFKSATKEEFYYEFFKKAYSKNISAIGITDYFSIECFLEAIKYQQEIGAKVTESGEKRFTPQEIQFIKDIFLFPNVELRMLPVTDKGRLINIHCLFNPEIIAHLENDFFSHIQNESKEKMNKQGLINYGKKLDGSILEEHVQYKKGVDNFVISLTDLQDAFENTRLRDNTLLVVSNSNKDGNSGTQEHYTLFENEPGSLDGLRESIYKISHAIFSSNSKDRKYFVGKKREDDSVFNDVMYQEDIDEIIRSKGSLKPCITGCDAHTEEHLFSRFTWVKADLNFEGLRQICFEPESRVKIQVDVPEYKEEKLIIDSVQFLSPDKVFSNEPINLNPNLNVIIGGKSSGKSILLYAIAKTLSANTGILKNDAGDDKYDFKKLGENIDFEIVTRGGFKQKLNKQKDENSILPEIKYIPQNYLVKLAEPDLNKVGSNLNQLVRDLITENDFSKEAYDDFVNRVKQNDILRNAKIELLFGIADEIQQKENELKVKSNKTILENNIGSNELKVEELSKEAGLTNEELEQYKVVQSKIEANKLRLQHWREDLSLIQIFNTYFLQQLQALKEKKDSLLAEMKLEEIKNTYTELYSLIDPLFIKAKEINVLTETELQEDGKRTFKNDNKFLEMLTLIKNEENDLSLALKPYLKSEYLKQTIEGLNISIANDKKAIADIDLLSDKIVERKETYNQVKKEIFDAYKDNYQEYINVIQALRERTIELEKDGLKIVGKAQFNFTKLRKDLLAISDGRSPSYIRHKILNQDKKSTDEFEFEKLCEDIKILFEDIISKSYIITTRTSVLNAVKLLLEDYFFDYWEITYKKDKLGEMSTGKASFVILMLIIGLSKSKAPILIDQPEDNLDNRSITTDLVYYLRHKKIERQIIVVTHNANIVVNADAENIIVANQNGQNEEGSSSPFRFDYINGAIENSFDKKKNETDILKSMGIRQHIADIVEGGKEAFIMREKRYRFR